MPRPPTPMKTRQPPPSNSRQPPPKSVNNTTASHKQSTNDPPQPPCGMRPPPQTRSNLPRHLQPPTPSLGNAPPTSPQQMRTISQHLPPQMTPAFTKFKDLPVWDGLEKVRFNYQYPYTIEDGG